MVDIITQRITVASILPYRDYCRLDERKRNIRRINDELSNLSDSDDNEITFFTDKEKLSNKIGGRIYSLPKRKKRKVNYFSTNDDVQENFVLDYAYIDKNNRTTFHTTSDRHIKNHYGRPLSSITIKTIERSIRQHGDKVTLKIYIGTKSRGFNSIYFKKSFQVTSITINLVNGNFTILSSNKIRGAQSNTFRTNSFGRLVLIDQVFNIHSLISEKNLKSEYEKIFDNIEFSQKFQNILGVSLGVPSYASNQKQFFVDFTEWFVKKKEIKLPNGDYHTWLTNFYPTEKYLKKNDRKLLVSILDCLGIKSKITNKILHKNTDMSLYGLYMICKILGDDFPKYVGNINPLIFEYNSVRSTIESDYNNKQILLNTTPTNLNLTPTEKENLIKIINSGTYGTTTFISQRNIQLIVDHFNMIEKIRPYQENIRMNARTIGEFHEEHRELTKIIQAIKKGWVIEYKFNEKMVEDVEKPIPLKVNLGTEVEPIYGEDLGVSFYPTILKREEEYIEEGDFMHHCVASYSDKDRSIIISVRTEDGTDRVTCEFNCQDGMLIQARHFCNKQPPADIEHVIINDLSPKVKRYARLGLLHASEKIKVPVKINGIEVKKETPTSLFGYTFEDFLQ